MNKITTVTTKGQVTIPENIRAVLGIHTGDKISFDDVLPKEKKFTVRVISSKVVDQTYGSLKSKRKFIEYSVARQRAGRLLGKKYRLK